jgi:hypothetical protein
MHILMPKGHLRHSLLNILHGLRIILLLIVYTTFFIEFDEMHVPDFPGETTAVELLVFGLCCLGLRCRVEYNNLFEWLKQRLPSCRFPYECGSGKCLSVTVTVGVSGFDDSRPISSVAECF